MSYGPGGFPFSSKGGKEIHVSEFRFTIDGAATQARMPIDDARCLSGSAAAIFTQALIDAHLGTSSEFTAAQFDATSLGADAQGIIIDMGCYSATGGATQSIVAVEDITTLQDSTLATECALGASGNVGIKIDWGNSPDFDGLTAGIVLIRVHWRSK